MPEFQTTSQSDSHSKLEWKGTGLTKQPDALTPSRTRLIHRSISEQHAQQIHIHPGGRIVFKKVLVVVIVVAALAGMIGMASALFSDTKVVDNNAFTSGTVALNTNPTDVVVTFSNMAPGDEFTAPILVTNTGTLPLRYAVTSAATDVDGKHLLGQLDMTIKTGVTACTNGGFGTDGSAIYGAADLGSLIGIDVVGDPTQGAQAGDRELAASAAETLCINVKLPLSTGNAFQGAATTATFTFAAEQTTNNP
jgi:predicted ribosomally synthesized peptide with SipW-like signal peptide